MGGFFFFVGIGWSFIFGIGVGVIGWGRWRVGSGSIIEDGVGVGG